MFPYSEDRKAARAEPPSNPIVAASILVDFSGPELNSGFRKAAAGWARVPEAAINKENQTPASEKEIGLAHNVQGVFHPTADFIAFEAQFDGTFRGFVAGGANLGHYFGAREFAKGVSHSTNPARSISRFQVFELHRQRSCGPTARGAVRPLESEQHRRVSVLVSPATSHARPSELTSSRRLVPSR